MAATQRAAAQAVAQAAARRTRVPERLDQANGAPAQPGPGRPPQATARLAQGAQDVEAARQAPQRLAGPRAMVPQSLRAIGHAAPCVDLERGGRRHGTRLAGAIPRHVDTIRPLAPPAPLSETSRERIEHAERVVPTRQATIAGVSGYGRQPVRHLDVAPPASYAVPAQRRPSCSRERVASTRPMTEGTPLRALAERLRPPRGAPGGACGECSVVPQDQRHAAAAKLAEVFQRSSAQVAGRNGDLSRRHHPLRGLDHPRKRACLTAVHHVFLTRPDGTTAAERFVGQKPRSRCAAIWASVEIPPAPLSPPRRAAG